MDGKTRMEKIETLLRAPKNKIVVERHARPRPKGTRLIEEEVLGLNKLSNGMKFSVTPIFSGLRPISIGPTRITERKWEYIFGKNR